MERFAVTEIEFVSLIFKVAYGIFREMARGAEGSHLPYLFPLDGVPT